jgi:hypothetical protein
LVGKPGGKRPLRRPKHRREDNMKMDLQDVGCGVMVWIYLAQDRDRWWVLVKAVLNSRVSQNKSNNAWKLERKIKITPQQEDRYQKVREDVT